MQLLPVFSAGLAFLPLSLSAAECLPPTIHFPSDGPAEYVVPDTDEVALRQRDHGVAPNADHLFLTHEGDGYWVPRADLDAAQVVLGVAADRFRYIGPDHCAPDDLPLDLGLSTEPEQMAAPEIGQQPKPGLWKLEATPVSFEGCPEVMTRSLPADMVALPAEATTPQRLDFASPFHPDQLQMRAYASDWKATGPGRWQTRAMEQVFAQAPSYGGKRPYLEWTLTVHDAGRISHRSEMHVVLPPEAVAVFKTDHCAAISTGHWIRVGD